MARRLLLIALLMTTCQGCALFTRYVYVMSPRPLISEPQRPKVPENPPQWTEREKILATYATTLEARIRAYNDDAEKWNKANDYPTTSLEDRHESSGSNQPVERDKQTR